MASAHLQTGLDLKCLDIGSDVTSQNECRKRLAKINFESLGFLQEFKILLALPLYIWTKAVSRDSPALSLQRGLTFLTGSSLYLLYRVAKPRMMSCVSCHVPATRDLLPPLSPVMLNRDSDASCHPILGFCVCEFSLPFLILRKIWTQSFCGILRTRRRSLLTELSDIYMVDSLEAGGLVCIFLPQAFYSAFDYHVLIVCSAEVQGDNFPCVFSIHV